MTWDVNPAHYTIMPSYVRVFIHGVFTASGSDFSIAVPFTGGTATIAEGTLDASYDPTIYVDGLNSRELEGERVLADSWFSVANRAGVDVEID